ncbi:glycerol kinase 5 [Limosa lapponica baueri]|uniref:Glycerol kinase 5 n=1 Tax=Limosa lapponica baueri TaxID=1758121 RepID=A0A2I0TNI3_LIMLA|nr:glycerol kinase 5 [Limosa lapponica baueri]
MPCGQQESGGGAPAPERFVVGVDVGSTVVKCHVYDRAAAVRGSSCRKAEEAARKNNCCFGTVDTWLLYRLTKGSVYATDYSNASSTGVFEPFTKCWNPTLCNLLSIPMSIYPPVKDTSFNFGSADSEIFGVPIPIMAVVADQQSAMFGECCFHPGDVKLTMGTGGFWNVNTGEHLFAWRRDLFTNVDETEKMARSIVDSQGVCFVPGFQEKLFGVALVSKLSFGILALEIVLDG